MWKKVLVGVTIVVTGLNFCLAAFSLLKGEVNLFNDVARDFLLLDEITEKTIVLIGPRSNVGGLFHGPLWSYLNYPVYLLGQGNPVVQGWFWLALSIAMVLAGIYIAKRLFGTVPACLYGMLLSGNMIYRNNDGFFHGHATIFLSAPYYYTLAQYAQTGKWRYLLFNLIIAGAMAQFMLALIPLFGLSFLVALYTVIKKRKYFHILTFGIVPLFFANFFLFDYRHNHEMFIAAVKYAESQRYITPAATFWQDRFTHITDFQLNAWMGPPLTHIFFVITIGLTLWKIRLEKKTRLLYGVLAFSFFGFMVTTFFNKGILLYHYVIPMMPITTLWFASLATGKTKKIMIALTGFLIVFNFLQTWQYFGKLTTEFMGKDKNSWLGMSEVAKAVLDRQDGKEFGYYVFAPDAFAYQPRYAMQYYFRTQGGHEYVKYPTTYVIAQEPPANDPYMTYVWWRKNPVAITNEPVRVMTFPNRFTVEEYSLTEDEMKIPHEKTIELGIHFR